MSLLRKFMLSGAFLLILSGCSSSMQIVQSGSVLIGMSKQQLRGALVSSYIGDDPFLADGFRQHYPATNREILAGSSPTVYFVFENVTLPFQGTANYGNGRLLEAYYDYQTAYQAAIAVAPVQTTTSSQDSKPSTPSPKSGENIVRSTSGTGFFITSQGDLLTNHHVVEDCSLPPVFGFDDRLVISKVVASDRKLDLALLKTSVTGNQFISISNTKPRKLQRIIVAGFPFGTSLSDDLKFTSGIVSSLKGMENDSTTLQIDAALNPGNSGGPIVDEVSGELVAVAVAGLRKDMSEAINFGIKSSSVRNFLDSNQVNYTSGKRVDDLALVMEAATVNIVCE